MRAGAPRFQGRMPSCLPCFRSGGATYIGHLSCRLFHINQTSNVALWRFSDQSVSLLAKAGTDIYLALIRKETRGLNPAGSSLNLMERTFSALRFAESLASMANGRIVRMEWIL